MPELTWLSWALLALAAVVVGLSKAALPGAGAIAVALFAAVLPAKQSTGTILLLLIVGDLFALWAYRRDANIRVLLRLIPPVVVGVLVGVLFMAVADDTLVRRVIAVLLLAVVAITLWRRRRAKAASITAGDPHRIAGIAYGTLGGFTTMVANAAGPIMSLYFLSMRFPVAAFLGTSAWFFAVVNVVKVPFAVGLGLITPSGLLIISVLVPVVIAAAFVGRAIARRINQQTFERWVIVFTIVGALNLLLLGG